MNKYIITLLIALSFTSVTAQKVPREGRLDPRIKTVEYQETQVYNINAHFMQTTMVVFAEDETIVHVSFGDPVAWSAPTVNNYISLKPLLKKADTNMNILTKNITSGKIRSYAFELNAKESNSIKNRAGTFMMKFAYPEDDMRKQMVKLQKQQKYKNAAVVLDRKTSAEDWNMEYTYSGNTGLVPVRVFDDGEFTYFKFPKNMDTPAIFLVADDQSESVINFHVKGEFVVVQRTGKQFILRDGNKATCVFNNAYDARGEGTVLEQVAQTSIAKLGG